MRFLHYIPLLLFMVCSCSSDDKSKVIPKEDFIRAADLSFVPEAESNGTSYKNNGQTENIITTIKNSGCNAIRIRLWKNPANGHSGIEEVKVLAQRVKQSGMKVWLTVHFSDTWADPAAQTTPQVWQGLGINELQNAAQAYTSAILTEIHPDIFQIGNETNDGFLWPLGKLSANPQQYLQLVNAVVTVIRTESPSTKIMLHYGGISGSDWFFDKVQGVDYDYIGLSYYPNLHRKSNPALQQKITTLGSLYGKKVLVAETSYPFTLEWNDWTNNIVGLQDQLIPSYSATPDGQKNFVLAVRSAVEASDYGLGFCYWGGEWVAFRGTQATNGSSYENQALYDFQLNALPVMSAFAE